MAEPFMVEWCPERALSEPLNEVRGESKGRVEGQHQRRRCDACTVFDDDAIVVEVPHFVYILRCADDSLYIGETRDLRYRLERHEDGSACVFTLHRRPVSLAYAEEHPTRLAALQRERQLKRWTRAKKEALIAGDLQLLKRL